MRAYRPPVVLAFVAVMLFSLTACSGAEGDTGSVSGGISGADADAAADSEFGGFETPGSGADAKSADATTQDAGQSDADAEDIAIDDAAAIEEVDLQDVSTAEDANSPIDAAGGGPDSATLDIMAPDTSGLDASAECGDCDDGLTCTIDGCGSDGVCTHVPTPGTCFIDGVCYYSATEKDQCNKCIPTLNALGWTSLDDVPCNDANPCSLADVCKAGACIGMKPNPCTPPGPCSDSLGCDVKSGECSFQAKVDGTSCGDGFVCQAESCVPGDSLPVGTVAWFDRMECPGGWAVYGAAVGRTITPSGQATPGTSRGAPLASGEEPLHTHSFSAMSTTATVSYVGIGGCCNGGTAPTTDVPVVGDVAPASAGLPYVELLVCQKTDGAVVGGTPEGLAWFTSEAACPVDTATFDLAADRLIVGTPAGGAAVATFGAGSVPAAGHTHGVSGTIPTPSHGIALASGCCAGGYAGSSGLPVSGSTGATDAVFPDLVLPTCTTAAPPGPDAAPPGLVLLSTTGACPTGWAEVESARGRLMVGAAAGGDVGVTVGAALSDKEDRTHTHAVTLSASIPSRTISAADGGNQQGAQNGAVSTTVTTGPATSGGRFIQLTPCKRL